MGFMNMIENIAQIGGKFAAIMKLLPAKGVKQ